MLNTTTLLAYTSFFKANGAVRRRIAMRGSDEPAVSMMTLLNTATSMTSTRTDESSITLMAPKEEVNSLRAWRITLKRICTRPIPGNVFEDGRCINTAVPWKLNM